MTSPEPEPEAAAARFWAIDLAAADQALLEEAFARDRELRRDTAHMFRGYVELDLWKVFVGALLDELRALEGLQPRWAL